jgi:hypothetical protein
VNAQNYFFLASGIGAVAFTDARDISAFLFFNDDTSHAGILESIELKQESGHAPAKAAK